MCGICGIFDLSGRPVQGEPLEQMRHVLRHRGPDGQGQFVDREVGLGHCRLSIIDVPGGGQPIANEDGSLQVIFNGEIYNFIELRRELEAFGHTFKTRSDTEVIVHAYEQWGTDCVNRFNGMFAFAVWDGRHREIFLARDHLGIKPLYYTQIRERLLFASEIKALLQEPECPREVDMEALAELFTFRCVPSPKTLFRGIYKLPPGHWMLVNRHGAQVRRFWNWAPREPKSGSELVLIEEYQALLQDAVRLQLRSDVPVGLFLSSGVDSGMLLAIMKRHAAQAIETFTVGFEGGESCNEVEDACKLAKRFGAANYNIIVRPGDYLQYFHRYMQDIEEPVAHEAAPAFYFLSRLAGERVKVALTGQGADEPWAGYDRYKVVKFSRFCSCLPAFVGTSFAKMSRRIPGRFERLKRALLSVGEPDLLIRFTKVYSFFSADLKAELYKGPLKEMFQADPYAARRALVRLQADVRAHDPLTQMLYIDTRASLPDDLLMVADKTGMVNSLEVRVPYLDYRLVEFIESLPERFKLRGMVGKYLHKRAARRWLPRSVTHRRKKGFDNPLEKWFRLHMRSFLRDCLLGDHPFFNQYFERRCIARMLESYLSGREQYLRHIYLLVSLALWYRTFIRA
jgi:asparagine synthase (glutamine-hydrolysing)